MHLTGAKWLIAAAGLFAAGLSGCSASGRELEEPGELSEVVEDGNAAAENLDMDAGDFGMSATSTDASEEDLEAGGSGTSTDAGQTGPLCDGSDDIRLGIGGGRGSFFDEAEALGLFAEPYGPSFLYVDGQCRFWIGGRSHLEGLRQGQLSEGQGAELAQDVGFHRLAEWQNAGSLNDCPPDSGGAGILGPDHAVSCCSCSGRPGFGNALAAARQWHARLWEGAEPLNADLHIAARLDPFRESSISNPANLFFIEWPLSWSLTEVAEADGSLDPDGRRIEDPEEQQTLRELRAVGLDRDPSANKVPVIQEEQRYYVYIRDDLPASTHRAIETFWRRER
jgi:hypothetical protein